MSTFTQTTTAQAVVPVAPDKIWAVLTDPEMVARLTPFVQTIRPEGEHWIWTMGGIKVGSFGFTATFTEKMVLEPMSSMEFSHDPPAGQTERAAVAGHYYLTEVEGGTHLETSLEVCISLPLPRLSGGMVRTSMKGVMAQMGDRFSKNLLDHLGVADAS